MTHNEDTKDALLPVVAYRYKVAYEFGGEVMCWEPNGRKVLETFPLADHTDAQALLSELRAEVAEKDALIEALRAEIAESGNDLTIAYMKGAADARSKIKEIERLKNEQGAEMFLTLTGEITKLRAQLQSAQARGAVVLPDRKNPRLCQSIYEDGHDIGWNDCLDEVARLNPAPATADSDVREVK